MGRNSITAVVLLLLLLIVQVKPSDGIEPNSRRPRHKKEKTQYTNVLKARHHQATPGPSIVAKPGDWRNADESGLTDVVRAHWVSLKSDGRLTGRISTFLPADPSITEGAGMRVYFVQSGRIVTQLVTDSTGRFET